MVKNLMENYTFTGTMIEGFDAKAAEMLKSNEEVSESWKIVFESRQNKTPLQAEVVGLQETLFQREPERKELCAIVKIEEIKGLIPLRFLDLDNDVRKAQRLLGQKAAFVVIAIDEEAGFFVGSRQEALKIMANAALKNLKIDDEITGVVRQVYPNNMLVDVGGIAATIYSNEVSYAWIDSLRDHYVVGEHVKVKIIEIDKENRAVKASIKALLPDPYAAAINEYQEGARYVGRVSGVQKYGIYVTLGDGISGLSPLAKFPVEKGDKVMVRFGKVDAEKRHINLRLIRKI